MLIKKNIMFITPGFTMGGAERWILSLVKGFKIFNAKRIFVTLGHFDQNLLLEAEKYTEVIVNDWKIKNPNDSIKEHISDIDVIISWGCSNLPEMTNLFTGPVIDVSHNDPSWTDQVNLLKKSSVKASHLVGVSKNASLSFPEYRKNDITVIYNGIETSRLNPSISREKQRKIWGIEKNKKVILFLSRLSKIKNPKKLIESLNYLPNDYSLVMISIGELYKELSSFSSDRIIFVSPKTNVGDYLNAADVLAIPSSHEGMPLTLLEAWYFGLPTVSSEYETYKEIKEKHGNLSWTVPVDCTAKKLAIEIKKAYTEKKSIRVKNAKKIVLNNYTSEKMCSNWESFIMKILKN